MIRKFLRIAEKLGLDKEELLQMTVIDAIAKIEETRNMWTKYSEEVR